MRERWRDLVRRSSQGDERALDDLLGEVLPDLRAYVSGRMGAGFGPRESPSDIVQSTCREVLEHADRFQHGGEEGFRRWLFTTALRKIRNKHRHHGARKRDARREVPEADLGSRSRGQGLEDLARTLSTPSQKALVGDEIARLLALLDRLPARYAEVLRLAYMEALSTAEIAHRLEIQETNARVLLSRARARLARLADAD